MICSLTGMVAGIGQAAVEIDVQGVGYLVQAPSSTTGALRIGQRIRLLTQMVVREDSMALYGFADVEQRDLFRCLTAVTGVGPKLALAVLSHLSPLALSSAVASSDVAALTAVPGVGKRSAERMILELKSQIGTPGAGYPSGGSQVAEVRQALLGLGYAPAELSEVLAQVAGEDGVEVMVKAALKALSRA